MTSQPQINAKSRRYKILAADDDPIMREMMMARLGDDVDVVCVEDGKLAWEKLADEHFDLAIIDLGMPNLDGFGLIQYLRQTPKTIDLPLIVATSRGDKEAIEKAFSSGASGFVTKPINWSLFQHEIKFVLKHGQTERELRATRAAADKASRTKDNLLAIMTSALQQGLHQDLGQNQDDQSSSSPLLKDAIYLAGLLTPQKAQRHSFVGVNQLIDTIITNCRKLAEQKAVKIIGRKTLADISINIDPQMWLEMLLRVTNRAINASPNGGTVEILLGGQRDGSLVFSVRDNGSLQNVADLENQANALSGNLLDFSKQMTNTHLSLAIVKQAMTLHGGRVLFQNSAANGNVVGLWLPNTRVQIQQLEQSA